MDRILLLMKADTYADADRALRSARDNAASSARVTYGLSLMEEPDSDELEAMRALGTVQFLTPADDPWLDMAALWQGEGYVLIGHPAMRFTRHWDLQLLHALRMCQHQSPPACALTGYLPRPVDPVDAVYPVGVESFDAEGRLCFHRGTPLRYAREPQRSAFLHPAFCFGPAAFFQELAAEDGPRFLSAFRQKWELFTLHRPLIHMAWDEPLPPCPMEVAEERQSGLTRFEKRFGLRLATRQLSAMARLGIFTPDLSFPTRVPPMVRVQEALRELVNRRDKVSPLCVTAFLTLPATTQNLPEENISWFSRLSALKNLALLCYLDGDMSRRLAGRYPNVLEYKRRYGLPMQVEIRPEDSPNFLRLSRPFLLMQSKEKLLGHTHYAWIDFGYLRYPVYEQASLNWAAVCGGKIVLAMVGGEPDTSMFVVPEPLLSPLCREIVALCEASAATGRGLPLDAEVWRTLLREHPDWFETVALPGPRELLGLTMLNREEEFHVLA